LKKQKSAVFSHLERSERSHPQGSGQIKTKIIWRLGGHRREDFIKTDLVVRNPDVPWYSPYLALARQKGVPIYNDVTLFLKLTQNVTPSPSTSLGINSVEGSRLSASKRRDPSTALRSAHDASNL
jgi:UDP-N-acetylmuramoylalanine-D-glutamate ligase